MENLEQLRDWLRFHGAIANDSDFQKWTGRSARTIRHWKLNGVPKWASECIERRAGLFRVKSEKSFEVWRLQQDGKVTCPAGDTYNFAELRAAVFYKEAMKSYRARAITAEKELKLIKTEYSQSVNPAANDRAFLPLRSP